MSTPKHTPGPWHIGLNPGPMVYGPQGEQIVGINVMLDGDEVLANAKFIAAAPAMYDALLAVQDQMSHAIDCPSRHCGECLCYISEVSQLIVAALAQAEGE